MMDIVKEWRKLHMGGRLLIKAHNRRWYRFWSSDDYAYWRWKGGGGMMFKSKQALIDFIDENRRY